MISSRPTGWSAAEAATALPANGWVEEEVEFHTLDSACSIVLGYGRQAKALMPAEMRDAVRAEAQTMCPLYDESCT
ncbi:MULTISPECIES: WYL domain-containing protein [Paenibacillaceae]|uniref:WYL domain-containing protein n=1 Tax=Paenibacillus residui TaxID=629724 RepID=A0ABW3DIA8_9BACL|nr:MULTISPECIES: WYL domain-containing protein [Paenibacillaceae]MBS5910680.1 WYL domain-containing protein [Paenibacillus macerans]